MAAGLRLLDIPFLVGNISKQVIMSCTRDIVINFVNFCQVWSYIHTSLAPWLSQLISQCSIWAHLWRMYLVDLVLKNRLGDHINCFHGNELQWNLYLINYFSLPLIQIQFCILLCCCMLKWLPLTKKIHSQLHIVVVFGHERGQGYPWDDLVVLWNPSDWLDLFDSYLGAIHVFCSANVVCGNWTVTDFIRLNGIF